MNNDKWLYQGSDYNYDLLVDQEQPQIIIDSFVNKRYVENSTYTSKKTALGLTNTLQKKPINGLYEKYESIEQRFL